MDNADIANLKQEFNYYIQHKQEFVAEYNRKFIVLKEHKTIHQASSRQEAISWALKNSYALGTFLVQYVTEDDSETVQRYCSRVYC